MRTASVRRPRCTRKAVERAGHGADRLLHEAHLLVEVGVAHDHRAADDVGVPAEVLRRRVHHGVGAVLERALVDRSGEGVVDRDERVAPARHHGGDVDDVEQRVGRRLDPDQPRVVGHRGGERVEVGLVDHRVAQAPAREHLVDEAEGAAVEVGGDDDVVAGLARRRERARGWRPSPRRRPCRGRPRARPARSPARGASGWRRARSRSPPRPRRRRAARRSTSGGWRG